MNIMEFRLRFGKAIMELIGTMMLVTTIQLALASGSHLAPLAISVVLLALVYAGAPVSGAHYNPAVTLALLLRGSASLDVLVVYWICQVVGGFAGAIIGGIISGSYNHVEVGDGYSTFQALLAELVYTSLLCFNVIGVATTSKAATNHYYGMSIGFTVLGGAIAVGPISGGAFNPAVALGLGVADGGFKHLGYALLVSLADMIGGVLAALCFFIVAPDEFEHFGDEAHGVMEASELAAHEKNHYRAPTEQTNLIT